MSKTKKKKSLFDKSVIKYDRALIYCRVSSDRQATEGHGLDGQEQRCREYASRQGYVVEKVFRDSFSGGGDFMNRPAMSQLIEYLDKNPSIRFAVIFDDLKRFARDTQFHIKLRMALKVRDAKPECLNFNFEDTAEGEFVETIFAAQGQLERKQNTRQVIQKMKARLESGYWTFGSKKGYTMIKDPLHGKLAVPHKTEAPLLKYALESFSTGVFVRKIDACKYLVENGFWGKQSPEKYIDKFSIILRDPFYSGSIEYPEWEVERRKGHHKAIISLDTYEINQRRTKSQGLSKRIRVDVSDDFPLRGLHVCGECNKPLTGAWVKGRSKKYPYYYCQNKNCEQNGKMIRKKDMEDAFTSLLKKQILGGGVDVLVQKVFSGVWQEEAGDIRKLEDLKQRKRQELEVKISELTDLIIAAKSDAVKRAYEGKLEEVVIEFEGIGAVDIDLSDTSVPYQTALNKATGLLKSPYKIWSSVDVLEKHRLYFFIFEEKLAYSKKTGYRTDNLPCAVRLFEEFACVNSHDVEMGGIEPPCRRCSCGNLLCVEYFFWV